MDSHEERVFNQIQQAQARAAQENAKEKEKQFKKERAEMAKKMRPGGGIASATAISSSMPMAPAISDMSDMKISAPKPTAPISREGGKALKLGAKNTGEDTFLQQLQSEGQSIEG
ncbi:hypothetical protein L596_019184 [Steinernema carpocapsae]|uniref:Coatomer subunit delta n=1 Tax=Steinernema carpocapsae TaxID=34508 RepID=A0A4U5N7R2_STECR|nr:hypothetical protein L596_019184 [Steinernema carpocapsae]